MLEDQKKWDSIHARVSVEENKHSAFAEEKEKLFPRGSLVCDLGGGIGSDALYFISKGHNVLLLDISNFALNHALKHARKLKYGKRLAVKQVDFGLEKLPVKDNSISICYSRIGLNYFPESETSRLIKDVYRILKPGGCAYLGFKSAGDTDELKFLRTYGDEIEPGVFIENEQIRSRFTKEQLNLIVKNASVSDFTINEFTEPIGQLRDENGINLDRPIYLNEIVFCKKSA